MKEKLEKVSIYSTGLLSIGLIVLVLMKYIFPILSPFLIAGLAATVSDRPAQILAERMKIPKRIVRLICSIFIVVVLGIFVGLLLWKITSSAWNFISHIHEGDSTYNLIMTLLSAENSLLGGLVPEELSEKISEAVGSMLTGALGAIASAMTSFVSAIPHAFFFLIVTLISLIYFALDYDRIEGLISSLVPHTSYKRLVDLKERVIDALGKYLRSYSLIMLITYSIMLIGLFLMRVESAAGVALLIASLDILPIIGVGMILVPWSAISFATGDKFLGVGLILLFLTNAVIRQLMEPKIVGKNLNLHPIATLMLLYVGYGLFGLWGMLILPLIAVCFSGTLGNDSTTKVGEGLVGE